MTKSKRVENGAPGLRLLITTTSIAATLGGWALLTFNQTPDISTSASQSLPPLEQTLGLAPIPTLIPRPDQNVQAFTPSQGATAPSFAQPASPRLRSVPVPVTATRSSR